MSNPVHQLAELGQSLWYDNIERRLIESGELARMINQGDIRGLTSNPSIFNQAIARSNDYDRALIPLARAGYTAAQIFDQLAVEDIQAAADLLRLVYEKSGGGDGYVSLEVNPDLAHDTQGTLLEARRLWRLVARPNLMIKIPATKAGIPAVRQAIAEGMNINITLIFSITRYLEVMDAYLAGLEERVSLGEAINTIASVASFFVSRIDTKVDGLLAEIIRSGKSAGETAWQTARRLQSQIAIANARLAYAEFQRVFESERFLRLASHGAKIQRPLWASTSTKNPALPDTLYVDELIGPFTVNTVPPQTLVAFKDHGIASRTVDKNLELARQAMDDLASLGISMDQVTAELEAEGVKAFADAFHALLETVESRRLEAASLQQEGNK
jgi:transaldolase